MREYLICYIRMFNFLIYANAEKILLVFHSILRNYTMSTTSNRFKHLQKVQFSFVTILYISFQFCSEYFAVKMKKKKGKQQHQICWSIWMHSPLFLNWIDQILITEWLIQTDFKRHFFGSSILFFRFVIWWFSLVLHLPT